MGIAEVRAFFAQRGMEDQVLEFPVSSATVNLAAEALGVAPARIAKSLSFKAEEGCILVVAAGDARVDNPAFRSQFQTKARMLSPEEVLGKTGHAVGGVCPFALQRGVKVYLDVSLKRFDRVYPACGSANSAIALTPQELYRISEAEGWVDVCKGWRQEEESGAGIKEERT